MRHEFRNPFKLIWKETHGSGYNSPNLKRPYVKSAWVWDPGDGFAGWGLAGGGGGGGITKKIRTYDWGRRWKIRLPCLWIKRTRKRG